MKSEIFLTLTGIALVIIGAVRGNELMLATGVVVIAIDCGTKKVIAAIKESRQGGAE